MKIAAHVDDSGTPVSLSDRGRVRLYDNDGTGWRLVDEFPFVLPDDGSLASLRAALGTLARALGECRVLLSAEVRGFAYSFLQDQLGFHIWRSEGGLTEQLDAVLAGEERRAAEACACPSGESPSSCGGCGGKSNVISISGPVKVVDRPDGSRSYDLIAAMAADGQLNSRAALVPLLAETPFRPLEIRLDHLPRWFTARTADLGLGFTEERQGDALVVKVTVKEGVPS